MEHKKIHAFITLHTCMRVCMYVRMSSKR